MHKAVIDAGLTCPNIDGSRGVGGCIYCSGGSGYFTAENTLSVTEQFNAERERIHKKHPEARVLSHPECGEEVLALSDYIGSTAEIISYAKNSTASEFIVCTEDGVAYKLQTDNPEKRFYFPKTRPCCADMKLNTLEKLLHVLKTEENEVLVNDTVSQAALAPLNKMLELAR